MVLSLSINLDFALRTGSPRGLDARSDRLANGLLLGIAFKLAGKGDRGGYAIGSVEDTSFAWSVLGPGGGVQRSELGRKGRAG